MCGVVVFVEVEAVVFADTLSLFNFYIDSASVVVGCAAGGVCGCLIFFWYGVLSFIEGHLCASFSRDWWCCVGGCISLVCWCC